MPPKKIPEALADSIIHNTIDLEKFGEGLRKKIIGLLNDAQKEIIGNIAAIDPGAPAMTAWRQDRFQKLNATIKRILDQAYGTINAETIKDLSGAAKLVTDNLPAMFNNAIGASIFGEVTLTPEFLKAVVEQTLVGGRLIGDWWKDQAFNAEKKAVLAMNAAAHDIEIGMIKGESIQKLIQIVRGTKLSSGILDQSRAQAAALTRTSVMTVLDAARQEVYNQNQDVLHGYEWVSMLDARTTPLCRSLAGKRYDLNFEPIDGNTIPYPGGPPTHWGCRSTLVPITKTYAELLDSPNLDDNQKKALSLMGELEKKSLGGHVPADQSYEDWLTAQDKDTQIGILGEARQKLFAKGKLSFVDLIHQSGRGWDVEKLKKKMEAQ